jgi:hypothetical protein
MRKQTAVWTTKQGEKIRICDMKDSHLINTIKLLRRNAATRIHQELQAAYSCLAGLRGEMAQFYCERDIDRLEEMDPDVLLRNYEIYEKLTKEAERRNLDIYATT